MNNIDKKLKLINYKVDNDWQHVQIINPECCRDCQGKPCLTICPTGVFIWNNSAEKPVLVFYKQCIECGACRLVCAADNIDFSYPRGGYGVAFHEG